MTKLPFILAAAIIGGLIAVQPGMNADLARRIGSPFSASVLSIAVSFALALVAFAVARPAVTLGGVWSMPLYLWLGGFIGFLFVVATLWLAPILGGAVLFASIVAGQMIVAMIADHYGFGAYRTHGLDAWRIGGIVLVIAGVLAFQRGG